MTHLLDTNAWIEYLRPKGNLLVKRRILTRPFSDLAISAVSVLELEFGAHYSNDPVPELAKVAALKTVLPILDFTEPCAVIAARIRADLARAGTPIGPYDLQIAATALAHGLTLVSHNTAEFSRVPGLSLEDWELP
jgi:tRNA(fMet)-specific endonuclease VapC